MPRSSKIHLDRTQEVSTAEATTSNKGRILTTEEEPEMSVAIGLDSRTLGLGRKRAGFMQVKELTRCSNSSGYTKETHSSHSTMTDKVATVVSNQTTRTGIT